MRKKGKESKLLWAVCLLLAIGGPLYIFRSSLIEDRSIPDIGLFQADAQKDPYCFDISPVGDGAGYDFAANQDCFFDSETARANGFDPRNYCYDTNPVGDEKGWNAFLGKTCFFGTDMAFGPNTDNPQESSADVCVDSYPIDGVGFNAQRNAECYLDSEVARANGANPRDYCYDADPVGDGRGYNAADDRTCFFQVGGPVVKVPVEEPPVVNPPTVDPGSDIGIPQNFRYSDVSASAITLSWEGVAGAEGYNIERNGSYLTTVRDVTSFTDSSVENLLAYNYRVSAFAGNQYSNNSDPVKVVAVNGGGDNSQPPADKATLPANLRDQYSIVFFDEFNGQFLDPKKWNTSFIWPSDLIINNEEQYYVDVNGKDNDLGVSPFSFDGSSITISASKTPSSVPAERVANQEYISGLITSYDAFKFTHGYAEARVKVPKGQGLWPAFWLLNAYYREGEKKPEIDIMEFLGHQTSRAYQTYHHFDPQGNQISSESHVDKEDYTDGYYIFSAEWKPGLIQFYIDGEPHHKIEGDGVANEQMYVLANLAVGGWWPGTPNSQTEFPAEYSIDWIRVYQKN